MNSPEVLYADEPTGALDSQSGGAVLTMLRSAADEGTAVVIVTHDREIASIANWQVAVTDGVVSENTVVR